MVNNQEFTDRLKKIITYYQLTASLFADKVGVQRSSISHILSGRNKPSLDFVLKVVNTFSEVDIYWLLNGKGSFPNNSSSTPQAISAGNSNSQINSAKKAIDRIVVFYEDGTFSEYNKS